MHNSFKVADGYVMSSGSSNNYTSPWIDVGQYPYFSMSVVFTGGSPTGTAKLQQSNDLQFEGGLSVLPNQAQPAQNSFGPGTTHVVPDAADVGSGNGVATIAVTTAGIYVLDQFRAPFRWVRLVYTESSNVNTQLDVFMTVKSG